MASSSDDCAERPIDGLIGAELAPKLNTWKAFPLCSQKCEVQWTISTKETDFSSTNKPNICEDIP